MKRNFKYISLVLLSCFLGLTSCSFSFVIDSIEETDSSEVSSNGGGGIVLDSSSDETSDSFSSSDDFVSSSSSNDIISSSYDAPPEFTEQEKFERAYSQGTDIRERYNRNYLPSLPSIGNSKMLVVPVLLKDSLMPANESVIKSSLNKAFFGQSSDTGWESVSSYYNKASYGKLKITGEVSDVLRTSVSYSSVVSANDQNITNLTNRILDEAYDMYFVNQHHSVSSFDSNNDEYIDGVYLVYLSEENSNRPGLWAYTYWRNQSGYNSSDRYGHLGAYCWSSYNFMLHDDRFSYDKPDAHTYIHESGHLQSLDDYYNYYDGSTSPVGGIDMMDHNIGDHCSFTKYSLGWTLPEVVKDTDLFDYKEITLRPFESSGDSIVIANNFNGTSLDEYLILEYYTPTGLNKLDSDRGYQNNSDRCFTVPGVKIYHVDQRLGKLSYSSSGWYWDNRFVDTIESSPDSYTKILASNGMDFESKRGYSLSGFNLVTLLDGNKRKNSDSETKFEKLNLMADNRTLFKSGDKFENHYTNFSFNDGSHLMFNIEIGNMNSAGVTIKLSRK